MSDSDRITALREKEYERLEKGFEHDFEAANYLMVAHGAALFACVSLLKDYSKTPQLHGVLRRRLPSRRAFIWLDSGYTRGACRCRSGGTGRDTIRQSGCCNCMFTRWQ